MFIAFTRNALKTWKENELQNTHMDRRALKEKIEMYQKYKMTFQTL